MDAHKLRRAVQQVHWRHTIDLGQGVVTPGNDPTPQRLSYLCLPQSLKGKNVLDVGAWDGFYSFEAERRGAARVVALDIWDVQEPVSKKGFELARHVLGSKVEDVHMDVLDVSPDVIGRFDIVLFLGVLYHLKNPLLALERLFSVTKELLVLESHVDLFRFWKPMMVFYPNSELNNDPTNWWGPTAKTLTAMLRAAGFHHVEIMASWPGFTRRFSSAIRAGRRNPKLFWATLHWKRVIVHARPQATDNLISSV